MITNKPSCMTCRHCNVMVQGDKNLVKVCRFLPPTVVSMGVNTPHGPALHTQTVWPMVTENDICAQHAPQLVG